ncbi:DMT family transporter [Arsenicicoccus dermatophilus]|uniref:DMT family transporter n=1 Tax=Arsenicicoccus dermatophilus TaxID=1076331 RepID=UPI001F4D32E4|nr:DMT family transporter [Arsenicicoccus dermatophilus]MCH8612237.1 DMT family transporter [Arsenicicoccus dermatophilus]
MPTDEPAAAPGTAAAGDREPREGRPVVALSAAAALLVGALASVQSRANAELAGTFGSAVDAALWSFGSGWVLLLLAVLTRPGVREGLRRVAQGVRAGRMRLWTTLGGLLGAFFVGVQSSSVPELGVALFTVAIVGGQTANALVVDRLGLGPAGRVPVSAGRVAAALLTFVGVGVAALARGGAHGSSGIPLLPLVLTLLAGAGMAVQQAINGRVNALSQDVLATTAINFTWGLLALAGWATALAARGQLHPPRTWAAPWWAFVGGVLGLVFVGVGAVVVRHLGVLVAALMTLTGQLVSAVLLDLLTPATRGQVGPQLLLGVGLTLLAALGAGVAAQRRR